MPSLTDWTAPILMIGCGNMAGAILGRWLDSGLSPALVRVVDPHARAVPGGIVASADLPETVATGSIVLLGVKPQNLAQVAPDLSARLGDKCTIVSMLAGIPVAQLRAALPNAGGIVRIMPNLPVRTGEGVVLSCPESGLSAALLADAARLLAPLGLVEPMAESDIDLGTAISGCGPAFVYRFVDALAAAGAGLGLDAEKAARLALHTAAGAAMTALRADQPPTALADAVASPGGMTRVGLDVLDAEGRLLALLAETLRGARDKGAELAASAKEKA